MTGERFVRTEPVRTAVQGHEAAVLSALGIDQKGRAHIHCPFPDHDDDNPSWRWDRQKARAYCTCTKGADIFDVIGRIEGIDFDAAKIRVAELIGRADLIEEKTAGQKMDAMSLMAPPAGKSTPTLPRGYLAHRLEIEPDQVPMPVTPTAGWSSLEYWDPPAEKGGKPRLVGEYPCAVFATVAPDGRAHAHRIYVQPHGHGKAELNGRDPKKSATLANGTVSTGCAVVWGDCNRASWLLLAEGIETAAALAFVFRAEIDRGDVYVCAGIAEAGVGNFEPWPATRRVTVCADRDEAKRGAGYQAGEKAARRFAERHRGKLEVAIAVPGAPGSKTDWLDVLLSDGAEAVRNGACPTAKAPEPGEGAALLDDVHAFLCRFVAYPSSEASIAHVLWIAHAHLMDAWESTPRIAFLSPEPASGKTRALEATELLVPRPVEAVNVSPAYLFRKVGSEDGAPTILFDEIDTVFGPKAKDNEEIRGLLNAGHRRGAVAGRCVVRGKVVETEEIPAYCAVALAGLGWLPDTILTRSVIVRMRRRAPTEQVEAFRRRVHGPEGEALRARLETWAGKVLDPVTGAWPEMPVGVEDRDADVWEPLLAVAEAAGGDWPGRARVAAVTLVTAAKESAPSLGIRLLADLRTVFGDRDAMWTRDILSALTALAEAPWSDLKGKPLNDRGLSVRLEQYGINSKNVRVKEKVLKGYHRDDLADAWSRYLPPLSGHGSATAATSATGPAKPTATANSGVADDVADTGDVADRHATPWPGVADVADGVAEAGWPKAAETADCSGVADVADLPGDRRDIPEGDFEEFVI